jgi:hypothetical protein
LLTFNINTEWYSNLLRNFSKHNYRASAETFGDTARIWLFGYRVDEHKRGGDIDLLIETKETDVMRIVKTELAFIVKLQM